jgi:hypothetical protein
LGEECNHVPRLAKLRVENLLHCGLSFANRHSTDHKWSHFRLLDLPLTIAALDDTRGLAVSTPMNSLSWAMGERFRASSARSPRAIRPSACIGGSMALTVISSVPGYP